VLGTAISLEESKVHQALRVYRYVSWTLTSLVYLWGIPRHTLSLGALMVAALLLAGYLATTLYMSKGLTRKSAVWLVLSETLGLALLLIPTGGWESPFVWYALNPIFMAGLLLNAMYCWLVLFSFGVAAGTGSMLLYQESLSVLWQKQDPLVLALLLITAAASAFSFILAGVRRSYAELDAAHQNTERLLRHTSTLYLALESFAGEESPARLAATLAQYARQLTGAPAAACVLDGPYGLIVEFSCSCDDEQDDLTDAVHAAWARLQQQTTSDAVIVQDGEEGMATSLLCSSLQSESALHGVITVKLSETPPPVGAEESVSFLANLGALALDRWRSRDIATRLRVAEEQNRIANEIHDGVAQHLFSLVYALHALTRQQGGLQEPAVQEQLHCLRETAAQAAKELRSSIYRISPRRRGDTLFLASLSSYLGNLQKLNNIKVALDVEGSESSVSAALQQAVYRIVKEATSNAIRHGKCSSIQVRLSMHPARLRLVISDDGRGFEPTQIEQEGLGLMNMRSLMASFGGSCNIESAPGYGTTVICSVPAE
jgi:NarL family two-component system sensor histidine kinase LiaS